jgi:hypothetical protein
MIVHLDNARDILGSDDRRLAILTGSPLMRC